MDWSHMLQRWSLTLATIGQLRHRLVLEAPQSTSDGAGGTTQIFTQVTTLWAGLHPMQGDVTQAPRQSGERLTHQIILRYRDGVKRGMRFRKGAHLYTVQQVLDPDFLKSRLVCLCSEECG